MAFSAETKILTNRGWKLIKDLSGKDKVLIRNFLGEAEFMQPFALKKSHYDGEIVNIGNKDWGLTLTPDHKMVFDINPKKLGTATSSLTANDVVANDGSRLFRRFRYLNDEKHSEIIKMSDGRSVHLSLDEWDIIVVFTILFGYIKNRKSTYIQYIAEEEQLFILIDILDRIGIRWSWNAKTRGNPAISLRQDSNLVRKLRTLLKSRARVGMSLPDKYVYDSPGSRLRHFMGLLIQLGCKPNKDRPGQYIFDTMNQKFAANIETMCLLAGMSCSVTDYGKYGLKLRIIPSPMSSWRVRSVEKLQYSGDVYEIDLFDGLVYVTEKSYPVWQSPK